MQTDSTTVLLHDHGLVGEKGALQVLQKLEENPLCERVIISHNSLGDRGVQGRLLGERSPYLPDSLLSALRGSSQATHKRSSRRHRTELGHVTNSSLSVMELICSV